MIKSKMVLSDPGMILAVKIIIPKREINIKSGFKVEILGGMIDGRN